MSGTGGMFEEVYRESLEGALRRKGPAAVLADLKALLEKIAPELDDIARIETRELAGAVQGVEWFAKACPPLREGLNARLAA